MNIRKTKYVIGATFLLMGVGVVVATTFEKSMQYYVTVDELMAEEPKYMGKELKVAGKVKMGSVQKDDKTLKWNFGVENSGKEITVAYQGAMPDTFKEGADVVVTGLYARGGQVTASNVLAKCASKYEEKLQPTLETKALN